MNNVLSSIDKNFIDKLVNNANNGVSYTEDINTLIFSEDKFNYDDKTVIYKNTKLLMDKFNFIYKEAMSPIDKYICKRIADFVIGKIIYYGDIITNFPNSLFSDKFIGFLIEENLFFTEYQPGAKLNTLFNIILGVPSNYFNIQYNSDYKCYYIEHAKHLKAFLNQQLLSYVILNNHEIQLVYNFLKLMSPAFDGRNTEDPLYSAVFEIFQIFYNGMSHMVAINIESVEFYKMVYKNKTYADINTIIDYYKKILHGLGEMTVLVNSLFCNATNFDINNFTETDIHNITHLSNITTYIGDNYIGFKNIFTPVILNILKSSKTNIHDKTTVILSTDYSDLPFIIEYIALFTGVEKYNTSNGFRFKIKVRTRILNMINIFFKEHPPMDLKQYITDNFITLYTSHINSIMTIISEIIDTIKNNPLGNNKMMLMKYLLYFDQSISFNKGFYKLFINDKESIYYFKIVENYYTVLKSFITNKVYTQLSFIKENSLLQLVELGSGQIVDSLFNNLFNNLDIMSQNENFTTSWATNSFFYNKDTFDKSCIAYGDFGIKENYTVRNLLEKISTNIENKIKTINNSADTYDNEIPDKFKDPIMLTPIKQPIEIPSVKIIVDKYTIYNHLTFNQTNPFTNESLTVSDLELYNNAPEVNERIKTFITDFNKWKTLHKTRK